jgi:hypothetical protein
VEVISFEVLKNLYKHDDDFSKKWVEYDVGFLETHIRNGNCKFKTFLGVLRISFDRSRVI